MTPRRFLRYLFTPPLDRLLSVVTVAFVALGVWLRSRGYLFGETLGFWLDETQWAIYLTEQPLSEHLIRPIGFMAVNKALASVFGPSETALRFLSWAAGVGTTALSPFLARRLYTAPAARLLLVAIIALHPSAIDLAREYKPYAVTLFFHCALVFLAARYTIVRTSRALAEALIVAVVSVLFAQDVVFAFPGFFLTLGIAALPRWRRHGLATLGVGTFVLLIVLAQYVFIWSRQDGGESQYWANKYDVFQSDDSTEPYWAWWIGKYWDMVAFPGFRRRIWESDWLSKGELRSLAEVDSILWLILHVLGVIAIVWRRRWVHALLLIVPLGTMTAFNYLGFWPYGAFRTNLFLLAYMAPIACAALDSQRDRLARWTGVVPAFALVLAPFLVLGDAWNARKQSLAFDSQFPLVLQRLLTEQGPGSEGGRELLFLDAWVCDPFDFYTKYHPEVSRTLGPEIANRFEPVCMPRHARVADRLRRHLKSKRQRVWLISGRPWQIERTRRKALRPFVVTKLTWLSGHALYVVRRR